MQKKILFLVCCLVVISYFIRKSHSPQRKLTPLQMLNVEALANGENQPSGVLCQGIGSLDCPYYETKVELFYTGLSLEKND